MARHNNKQKDEQLLNMFKAFLAEQSVTPTAKPKQQRNIQIPVDWLCFVGAGEQVGIHRNVAKLKSTIEFAKKNGVNTYIVKTADGKWTTETR